MHTRRGRIRNTTPGRRGTALAIGVAAALAAVTPAHAGDYHQVICADPETGHPVGGGLPDGMTFYTNDAAFSGASQPANACAGPNHRGLAIVAQTAGPWADGTRAAFQYSTPPGLVLEEGVIYRFRRADTRFGNRISSYQHSGPASYDGHLSPHNHAETCNWAAPACFSSGAASGNDAASGGWNQAANRVSVVHANGRWTYNMVCESQDQPTCTPSWAPAHYVYLFGGRMRLREDDAPSLTAAPSGSLREDEVLRGAASLTYSAADGAGAGLYRVIVEVDGARAVDEIVDPNGGRCRDVNPSNGYRHEFAFQRPCVATVERASVSLDTTTVPEGSHLVSVTLEDAARNRTELVSARRVTIDNVPPPRPTDGGEPTVAIDGGRAVPGAQARASRGTWTGEGNSYEFRWQRCRADGGECHDIAGADDEGYVIASADVGRRLRVRVTASNAEGETDAFSEPTGVVEQAPAEIEPEPRDEGTTPRDPATPPDPRGEPNGTAASDRATLSAGAGEAGAPRVLVAIGQAVDVTGRLLSDTGVPISGATLEVLATPRRAGAATVAVGTATTDSEGRYRWRVPAGTSRALRVGYRTRSRDAAYAATADVEVLVRSAARLRVTPRGLRNGQAVRFTGQLLGEPPTGRGVAVVLEARVGRRWQPFARVRSGRGGRFAARYRFRATTRTRTYAFRAVTPRDANWAYEPGQSNVVRVRVRAR
jgi:hypothetical protein